MKIGIVTRYLGHEATFAALRLAKWMTDCGHSPRILAAPRIRRKVDTFWDCGVHCGSRVRLTDWATDLDAVLWTHVPHVQQLNWVKRQRKKTAVFVLWQELEGDDFEVLARADTVLAPVRDAAEYLVSRGVRRAQWLAWDAGLPPFCKPRDYFPCRPRVLLPLYDGTAYRTEMTALELLERCSARYADVSVEVIYNASTLNSLAKRKLRRLQKQFPSQVQLHRSVPQSLRPFVFQSADLLLWPTHFESTCMTGLMSVAMGTPILTFGVRPLSGTFVDGVHGVLVPTQEVVNDMGLPYAAPDYTVMDQTLQHLLEDRDFLAGLFRSVLHGFAENRRLFNDGLLRLFPT